MDLTSIVILIVLWLGIFVFVRDRFEESESFLGKSLYKIVVGISAVGSVILIFSWIGFAIWSVFIAGY
jgi:hypothetical protein